MLHGLMGGVDNWRGIIPLLPESCRPMTVRLPFLDERENLKSVGDIIEYAAKKIDDSGIERFVLMGNSIGGHVAVHLVSRYRDRVVGLVLTASGGLFERGTARISPRPTRAWVRKKCCEVFYDPKHVTDEMVDDVFKTALHREVTRSLVKLAKSAKRDNVASRLGDIECPTLLIWGVDDIITPPCVGEEFHRRIPQSEMVWLNHCGHAPMIEHPEAFAFHLGRWWNQTIVSKMNVKKNKSALACYGCLTA